MMMAAGKPRAAKVFVSYSQYYVQAGLDRQDGGVGDDLIPGLLTGLGPQEVMVITGLQTGTITVTASALSVPPTELDPGWDVAGETDLESPEGQISVVDWAGPDHPELGPLGLTWSSAITRSGSPSRTRARAKRVSANEGRLYVQGPPLTWLGQTFRRGRGRCARCAGCSDRTTNVRPRRNRAC
jgi:hypothetical protein